MSRDYSIRILEVHLQDGTSVEGELSDEQWEEADEVFYAVSWNGEDFYRWVSGPFGDLEDAEAAIEDEQDFYSETK